MKLIKMLVAASVAAAGLAASVDVQAQAKHGWSGHRHHHHGHRGHWHGPRLGFYIGAPIVFGSGWWGYPWYDEPRVIYREVIREPEVIETVREVPAPSSAEAPRTQGAPSQGPLYMNYCESSKAYFPKVTSCPEGWKFIAPNQ